MIHATARSGNFEVLQLLLEKKIIDTSLKYNKERTILHWLAGVGERKPGDGEKIEKGLKLLLDSNCILKKGIDFLGDSPLYITVKVDSRIEQNCYSVKILTSGILKVAVKYCYQTVYKY